MAATGMDLDVEMAMELFKKTEQFAVGTDEDFFKPTIDALEETETTPIQGKITKLPLEGVSTAGVTEYYVTIQLPGNDDIRISMSANAKIITSSKKDVLMIPVDAVIKENGESFADLVLEDGNLERKVVEIGDRNVSYVEIKGGLNEGDKVVIPEVNSSNSLF